MKILYAVQATGNGHITRARIMAKALKQLDVEVDWVFSGRSKNELFDMDDFGDFKCYQGLTFVIKNGKIKHLATAFNNNIVQFIRDVKSVSFKGYDLVINDFEPVTAWAAKLQKVDNIGISHQMSFKGKIPVAGKNFIAELVLKNFAPVKTPIGLHWDDFEQNLLPPIIDSHNGVANNNLKNVLVYFPFCEPDDLINWFAPFKDYQFHIFHGCEQSTGFEHIKLYDFSREKFQTMQNECSGIITGAGFELPSEAIAMGHKLLVLPLAGQMEQQSNALALAQIKRATVLHEFSHQALKEWLAQPALNPQPYPDVAKALCEWLVDKNKNCLQQLSKKLWHKTNCLEQA